MSSTRENGDSDDGLGFIEPLSSEIGDAELRLDALLAAQIAKQSASAIKETPISPLDRMRRLFETDLMPVVEELRSKYAESGLTINMDASGFLGGGRGILIVIEFHKTGLRMEGTVMPAAIAFQQTRYTEFDRGGLAASGPTLRARTLDASVFRDFLCERITGFVQAVVGRRR